ncbi:MAG: hypothetical protein DMF85_18515, partial [Acidobacteria bacterium]
APLATHVRPASFQWARVPNPYAGGDPISYLRFAREMKSFYQAHVREPMFLALTRAWLWLTADQDVGISFASASASVAAVFATYLLGATAFSPPIGLFAALAFAIDWAVIDWSNGGWRDDLFAGVVTFSAWAFVRARRDPRARNAALLGVLLAAASLTRITALSFAIPALLWSIVDASRPERRARARAAAIAAVIAALLVAPYLVNCARAFGDPFIAIDVHTDYYLTAEGGPPGQSVGALTYIADKIRHRPVAAADTAVVGLFVRPLADKWSGLDFWIRGASVTLFWCAIAGLGAPRARARGGDRGGHRRAARRAVSRQLRSCVRRSVHRDRRAHGLLPDGRGRSPGPIGRRVDVHRGQDPASTRCGRRHRRRWTLRAAARRQVERSGLLDQGRQRDSLLVRDRGPCPVCRLAQRPAAARDPVRVARAVRVYVERRRRRGVAVHDARLPAAARRGGLRGPASATRDRGASRSRVAQRQASGAAANRRRNGRRGAGERRRGAAAVLRDP